MAVSTGKPEKVTDESSPDYAGLSSDGTSSVKVVIAVPCLNEEAAIGSMVLSVLKYSDFVVVIDDGSRDRTSEIARRAGADVVVHDKNLGKGGAIKSAFDYAIKEDADVLVLIDGDWQHDPDDIPSLIEPIIKGEADMVNGSRFIGEEKSDVPKYRRVGQEILTLTTNMGTNKWITDTQSGFRAFSKRTFGSFSFEQRGMGIESEMLMDASRANLRIVEVPIKVKYDVDGSTYHPVRHGLDVLNSVVTLISERKPLFFFGVPGFMLVLFALGLFVVIVNIYNDIHTVAVGYALIGVLCMILGVFSMFTGLILWSFNTTIKRFTRENESILSRFIQDSAGAKKKLR